MNAMGYAAESPYAGPVQLQQGGKPKGTTVLVLGAGVAGLVVATDESDCRFIATAIPPAQKVLYKKPRRSGVCF